MRPIPNSETDPSTPAPEESQPDAYDAPTTVGPMSGAIAQLIEAERERAEAGAGAHDKDSTRSGVRPAITDGEKASVEANQKNSSAETKIENELPMLHDEASGEYEPTLRHPMAMELINAQYKSSEAESAAVEGIDVVAAIVREMEGVDAAEREKSGSGSSSPSGSSRPPKRPSVPRPKPPTQAPPQRAPDGASPTDVEVPPHINASESTTESATENTPPLRIVERPKPRIAFPEWVGISVRADELVGDRPKHGRRQMIRIAGIGLGVVTIVVGIMWWLLSLF